MMTKYMLVAVCAVLFVQCASEGERAPQGSDRAMASPLGGSVASASRQSEAVSLTTSDGVVITGTMYAAAQKAPALLCLHQWRSDRSAFAALAAELQKSGFSVLAIDMRGHGGSVRSSTGGSVQADRNAMADVASGVAYLRKHASVDAARIGIIGASYGASNAVMFAAEDGGIGAVAMFSPGLNYFNVLPIEPAVSRYGGKMFAAASREDVRSADAVKKIRELAGNRATVQLYDNAGHGTDMLDAGADLQQATVDFFRKNL